MRHVSALPLDASTRHFFDGCGIMSESDSDERGGDMQAMASLIDALTDKLEARQSLKADRARREYNFDFDAGRPLRGEIEWTKA